MQESKHSCASYLPNLSLDLDEIWHAVETCWTMDFMLILYCSINKGKIPTCDFTKTKLLFWLTIR